MSDLLVLNNLIHNKEFTRQVLPHIKREYFASPQHQVIFDLVSDYFTKYTAQPTVEALEVSLDQLEGLNEHVHAEAQTLLKESAIEAGTSLDFLIDTAQTFCQDRALFNAMRDSVAIMEGKHRNKNLSKTAIPTLLSQALAVSFDNSIGHDYLDDAEERFVSYHIKTQKIPFDLEYFNQATNGGADRKTLSVILGGTNVGKTLIMCHVAAAAFMQGFNVLYVTLEMAQERIAARIDANLLDITSEDLELMPKEVYLKRMSEIRRRSPGKLIIKEFPTSQVSTDAIKNLIEELKIKKGFTPDVIVVDYINIINSARFKPGSNANSYTVVKAAAEELRGIAVQYNAHVLTGTQLTRTGFSSSDPELGDTAESFGLPATADWMIVAVSTEELEEMGQYLMKQLKSRYKSKRKLRRFVVGVDVDKQKLFDVQDQSGLMDDSANTSTTAAKSAPKGGSHKFKRVKTS